jgi:hypothetical protein
MAIWPRGKTAWFDMGSSWVALHFVALIALIALIACKGARVQ